MENRVTNPKRNSLDEGYCSLRMAKIASNLRFIAIKFPCSKFGSKKKKIKWRKTIKCIKAAKYWFFIESFHFINVCFIFLHLYYKITLFYLKKDKIIVYIRVIRQTNIKNCKNNV